MIDKFLESFFNWNIHKTEDEIKIDFNNDNVSVIIWGEKVIVKDLKNNKTHIFNKNNYQKKITL